MKRPKITAKPVKWFMALLAAALVVSAIVSGCSGGSDSSVTPTDTTAPTVSSVNPVQAAINVAPNRIILATFSEAMDPATITDTTFTFMQGTTPVSGAVSYVGTTAIFRPAGNLANSTTYTGTLTTGVKNLAGHALASAKTWSFTTGITTDATAPLMSSAYPPYAGALVPLNSLISLTFSEAMDPATFTSANVVLMQGTTPVPGTISYVGTTATFRPASNFAANTTYTGTVTTGVKDLAGNALASAVTGNFTTGTAPDMTAPTVSSTTPAIGDTGVLLGTSLSATFSELIDPATITTSTFTLMQGTTPVPGVVGVVGMTAFFNPDSNLAANTTYTGTLTTGIKDMAGNPLASAWTGNFTTGASTDIFAPSVHSTIPADTATGAALNGDIAATFSEEMNPLTITTATFTLMQGTTPVPGKVTYANKTAIFNPLVNFAASTVYTATLSTAVECPDEIALAAAKTWSFTTGTATDTTAPIVNSTVPADTATGVAPNAIVRAVFNEAMDAASITTATFTLKQGTTPVPGAVSYLGTTAIYTPTGNLAASTVYTATVNSGFNDLAGNPLTVAYTWSFTTGTTLATGPTPVILGTAFNYAILAETGVATMPSSVVTGHVGVSPYARTALTGWSETSDVSDTYSTSAQVVAPYKLFAADYVGGTTSSDLTSAVLNMGAAYTDAAGRTATSAATTNVGSGTLTNLTLTAGVYEWGSGVSIPTDLTLTGSATDVWIFKVAGTLDMANAKSIILAGNALPKNVFWQVSGTVNIGANTHFEGIILGQTAITMGHLSSINGRLLAQSAVNIDATTVTHPAP